MALDQDRALFSAKKGLAEGLCAAVLLARISHSRYA
jgi:hypothetical protein